MFEQLLSQVLIAIATYVSIALVQKLFFGPKLAVRLRHDEMGVSQMTLHHESVVRLVAMPRPGEEVGHAIDQVTGSYREEVKYARLQVLNEGYGLAKGCRGFLADIQFQPQGAAFRRIFFDSVPLAWSYLDSASPQVVDLPTNIAFYLDILRTDKDRPDFRLCMVPEPIRYRKAFSGAGVYRLKIVVTSESASPRELWLEITWRGDWSDFDVKEIRTPL